MYHIFSFLIFIRFSNITLVYFHLKHTHVLSLIVIFIILVFYNKRERVEGDTVYLLRLLLLKYIFEMLIPRQLQRLVEVILSYRNNKRRDGIK